MKMLKEYFELQEKIYKYFGFEEQWQILPLSDNTDDFWHLSKTGVVFSKDEQMLKKGSCEETYMADSHEYPEFYGTLSQVNPVYRGGELYCGYA